eukprot:6238237-Prymnesium_polylepis.2
MVPSLAPGSLAPGSQHERRRIRAAPPPAPLQEAGHTALLRACLWDGAPPADAHGVWIWEREDAAKRERARERCRRGRVGRPAGATHGQGEPVRTDGRAALPRHDERRHGRRRRSGGAHRGGVVQHCIHIAHGAHRVTQGTSLTKEPVVAAAYGHKQRIGYTTSPTRRAKCSSTRPSWRRCKTARARRVWPGRTP